jgi:large subunit ribosomal protein L17
MRHGVKTKKLQRDSAHRKSLIANLIISLIEHRRIRTTVAKAKAVRPFAEKILTLGKKAVVANANREDTTKDTPLALHYRRQAISKLHNNDKIVRKLIAEIAPASLERKGGYTRITKLGQRRTDSAPMAFIEWVDLPVAVGAPVVEDTTTEDAAPAEVVEAEVVTEAKPKKAATKKAAAKKAKKTEE